MKKLFALIAVFGMLMMGASVFAQDVPVTDSVADDTAMVAQEEAAAPTEETAAAPEEEEKSGLSVMHTNLKTKFIEGGAGFMGAVLMTLIFGLALAFERVIYLNLATTNTEKLLIEVENALDEGGVEAAKEVCRNARGPVASIFYQGLDRADQGIDVVEKSVVSYGSVQMGLLEKNLSWISLFISVAPMLGFMGTVIGMIQAFDKIQEQGDVSPTVVAGGIKIALITTVTGLIVAIILQFFYNYLISKVDGIVNKMEDASISLVDMLVKHNLKK
ncbi:MAG: MotA/TolQ/ExbB proton channel family protein [Bacteroidales bacterium]|nr:MotA/TolQ/ExbB proton channel family protein [Bacteroidales bacterium]MDT8432019.1 MotA/TolQ/ExbB proton channel family protein [Bacteroidales bacterium]